MRARAVWSHIITSHYGVSILVAREPGRVAEVTNGKGYGRRARWGVAEKGRRGP
ncbi:MAG: hypothetical protein M3442_14210 [Chloroflexota bacterium]|nr:hypothetical protein [Chloroflexota bacterium]